VDASRGEDLETHLLAALKQSPRQTVGIDLRIVERIDGGRSGSRRAIAKRCCIEKLDIQSMFSAALLLAAEFLDVGLRTGEIQTGPPRKAARVVQDGDELFKFVNGPPTATICVHRRSLSHLGDQLDERNINLIE
jgi:hypothetical protein